jgi:uncharacterized protein
MATVIFKTTTACNARCIYCDGTRPDAAPPARMTLELLELFFSRIDEFLKERPQETMEIIWHGGEPLLLGPEYFEHALSFQQKHCATTAGRIHHSMQSNLTLFRREFIAPLKALGISSFGSSYEIIDDIRGLGPSRDSVSYNRRFLDTICELKEEGINWGVIYVVTKPALPRAVEIFRHLANLCPWGTFSFNSVLLYGNGLEHLRISPAEYADFLGAILPEWWRRRDELSQVQPFASLVGTYLGETNILSCCDSGACARSHFGVLPDGSISHCGRSADWNLLNYGSIVDRSISQVFDDPQREVLMQRNTVLPEGECKDCHLWKICHGGCPLDAWSGSGSFLHKTEWCEAKKRFLKKYVEPVAGCVAPSAADSVQEIHSVAEPRVTAKVTLLSTSADDSELTWIHPYGGLGDSLMISGVLKQVSDRHPEKKFNLVDRSKYRVFLEGHPAIHHIGHPPPGARLLRTDYWNDDAFKMKHERAYQVLARLFGLETPVEETLYVPWELQEDQLLTAAIPWHRFNVLIAHSSESPRKQMPIKTWETLVSMLRRENVLPVQATRLNDRYIRGAYSLLGLTTPRQLISMMKRFDAVITSDNLVMHAAHLCGVPAVVMWGPTSHQTYGYPEQIHLQADPTCEYPGGCLGPDHPGLYLRACPQGEAHCMNSFGAESIHAAVMSVLGQAVTGSVK